MFLCSDKLNKRIFLSQTNVCALQITPKVNAKQYLVVKFIGSSQDRKGLRCVSSNWLNSVLDKIVFVRFPPPNEEQNTLDYMLRNLPVFCHWQTYLATVYYETGESVPNWSLAVPYHWVGFTIHFDFYFTDDLGDALLYAIQYTFPCNEAQSNPTLTFTTSIQHNILNEPRLTLIEQFKIIRPLVISILRSIDLCSDEYRSQSQASCYNPHYEYLKERTSIYAKFLQAKMIRYISLHWTDATDEIKLLSTPTTATHDVSAPGKAISDEVKKAILQLLSIIDTVSE